ncbi:MAG TPA: tRNA uridine-5-carboxymethylaminomethyl(34) synthesis enzyme MnmG, partial [Cyanobacteria bacterium UBA11148]|nr:tRNA uridine-5-carboxymethylaminomethyl(34) synthesis enzyme MnmG [Cyanobacteria bacterium UBA11148]
IKGSITLADLLRRPGFHYINLDQYKLGNPHLNQAEREGAEIDIKYAGYLQRQQSQIEAVSRQSHRQLPADLDYNSIETLSKESREKLMKVRPLTIGQASRIGGVNPADINALLVYLEVRNRTAFVLAADFVA